MNTLALVISSSLMLSFLVFFLIYHQSMIHRQHEIEKAQEQDRIQATAQTLDKFFDESEKEGKMKSFVESQKIKAKMEADINRKAEARKAVAREQLKDMDREESDKIEEAEREFLSFSEGLKSATPTSDTEKIKDITDLKDAVASLEALDQELYKPHDETEIGFDTGKGMYYDSISQKLVKIIKTHKFDELPFIQAEKLENEALDQVKNLDHEDFLATLKVMKTIGSIKDIIELNPESTLIVFSKNPIKFSSAEKVVITFSTDESILTLDRLKKRTQWTDDHLKKTLDGLVSKDYLQVKDNNLIIRGLTTLDERKGRMSKLTAIKERKTQKQKSEEETEKKKQELLEQQKKEQEIRKTQELSKQREQLLKEARTQIDAESKKTRLEVDRITEEDERLRLEKIKAMPKPTVKVIPLPGKIETTVVSPQPLPPLNPELQLDQKGSDEAEVKNPIPVEKSSNQQSAKIGEPVQTKNIEHEEDLSQYFAEATKSESEAIENEYDELDQIIDEIMGFFESQNQITGGLISKDLIQQFLKKTGHRVKKAQYAEIIDRMKQNTLIYEDISLSGQIIYLFKDIVIDDEMKTLMKLIIINGEISLQDLVDETEWEENRVIRVLKRFETPNLCKLTQEGNYYFPGVPPISK